MSAADKASATTQTQENEKGSPDPAEIREEIEETRGELGETVAAVAEKTDVKKQAEAKVQDLGEKAKQAAPESANEGVAQAQRFAQENPLPVAAAGAFLAGLLLGRILYR